MMDPNRSPYDLFGKTLMHHPVAIKDLRVAGNGQSGTPPTAYIRGRVSHKSALRSFETNKACGNVFDFKVYDGTGEIKVVVFSDPELYEKIKINHIISIRTFVVKEVGGLVGGTSRLELSLNRQSVLDFFAGNSGVQVPPLEFNFVPLSRVDEMLANRRLDVLVVTHKIDKIEDLPKDKPTWKQRSVWITDASKHICDLVLRNEEAILYKEPEQYTVLAIKNGKVLEYEGRKSVLADGDTTIWKNPNLPAAADMLEEVKKAIVGVPPPTE